jgi:hypothetical protein
MVPADWLERSKFLGGVMGPDSCKAAISMSMQHKMSTRLLEMAGAS